MLTLRPYQEAAKHAVYDYLRTRDSNPAVVIPTAGGKTPIMASICLDAHTLWGGRVLVLAHVKELLQQTAAKLVDACEDLPFGVYSAGLKRRDTDAPVIVAGIQSVCRRACELGPFDLVVVDEAHMIPSEGDGMYRQFLAEAKVVNPHVRVVGFTATPFRMKSGPICTPEGLLNEICFEVGIPELIRDGFLAPVISKAGGTPVDTTGLHVRGGDFQLDEIEALMDQETLVQSACSEIVAHMADRRACLIFASGVPHGRHIVEQLQNEHGVECGFVCADTPDTVRDDTLNRFRRGELRYLANVNVLTTGFDAPIIDCVAIIRPTMSPGLYYQMVGRGFRLHPGKDDCLVLDFGENVLRHGPVDQLKIARPSNGTGQAPVKECPNCVALIAAGFARCPHCGHQFPPPERQAHAATASEADVLSGSVGTAWYVVQDVTYRVHTKRGASDDAPKTLRVDYHVCDSETKSEWICFEHQGYARQKAVEWWQRRSPDPVPDTAERALEIIEGGGLARTLGIIVRTIAGDPYERIVDHELGPMPVALPVDSADPMTPEEIPF